MEDSLLLNVENGVATITINRPDKRNSFTDEMVLQWVEWLEECKNRADVNVIVFTGAGEAFSAGGDTGAFKGKSELPPLAAKDRMVKITQSLARKVAEIDKPIVAAVNGIAVGGGMDIALMCDIRVATASARFAETYAKMGLIPGVGGTYFLPRIIGTAAALDLFWSSRWVDANEALSLGLVTYVYPDDVFRAKVQEYAERIASAAPLSIRYIKRLVYQGQNSDMLSHLDGLSTSLALVRTSNDHKEALAALNEKRTPKFSGT
jgi:enoyl-CoA hydratase/carnithine racemase